MKKLGSLAVLITLTGLVGCGDASEITSPNPQFRPAAQYVGASATKTACHTVTFVTDLTPSGDVSFSGTVTGDLQGSVEVVFDEFHPFTGVTRVVAADATWTITGGELAGTTFVTRLTNRNVFIPNSSTVKNIGSLRESSGIGSPSMSTP